MESQEFSEKQADFFGKFGAAIFPIIVQEAHNSVMISDDKGIICWVNSSFTRITGYLPEEAIGKTPAFLRAPGKHSDGFYKNLWQRVVETSQWKGEIWSVNKDGLIYPGDVFLKAILDPVEKTIKFTFAVMRDLSEQKRAEDKLRRIALHDALTDLPNRLYFTEKLKESLIEARRNGSRVALFYIDLDEFKLINDNHSHECGDFILHEFAKRLQGCLHDIDFIARLGSDEFVVISKNIADSQQASLIAEKIISAMKPIAIFECKEIRVAVEIKLSIGIAIFPDDARTEKDLISYSSKAMYKSKSDCREAGSACHGAYQFYNPQMCADVLQREMLRIAMLKALDADEFTLMYQPQVATDGRLYGLEALIRWYSPELGQVSPGYFIPAAELMRLIIPIGTWVLNEACRQIRLWCNMGLRKKVSVNVSGKQFNDPNFVDIVYLVLGRHGIDPDLLVLEITESQIITEEMIEKMQILKSMRIRFNLDDFGTEFSNLRSLGRLPIDALKVDQSFTRDTTNTDPKIRRDALTLIKTIGNMADGLDLKTIVEGVETKDQLHVINAMGFEIFQGYFFHRPLVPSEIERLFKNQ